MIDSSYIAILIGNTLQINNSYKVSCTGGDFTEYIELHKPIEENSPN